MALGLFAAAGFGYFVRITRRKMALGTTVVRSSADDTAPPVRPAKRGPMKAAMWTMLVADVTCSSPSVALATIRLSGHAGATCRMREGFSSLGGRAKKEWNSLTRWLGYLPKLLVIAGYGRLLHRAPNMNVALYVTVKVVPLRPVALGRLVPDHVPLPHMPVSPNIPEPATALMVPLSVHGADPLHEQYALPIVVNMPGEERPTVPTNGPTKDS